MWVAYVVGGAFVAGGVAAAMTAADYRLEFDAAAATVQMIRRGALGTTRTAYPFASIRDIGLEVSAMGRGQPAEWALSLGVRAARRHARAVDGCGDG